MKVTEPEEKIDSLQSLKPSLPWLNIGTGTGCKKVLKLRNSDRPEKVTNLKEDMKIAIVT